MRCTCMAFNAIVVLPDAAGGAPAAGMSRCRRAAARSDRSSARPRRARLPDDPGAGICSTSTRSVFSCGPVVAPPISARAAAAGRRLEGPAGPRRGHQPSRARRTRVRGCSACPTCPLPAYLPACLPTCRAAAARVLVALPRAW